MVATRLEDGARDPEVGEHRVPVDEEHVFWLDVPVNEPLAMRVVESRAQLARDAQGILEREPLLAHEALAQRFAAHVRHHVVEGSRRLSGIDEWKHVGVGEPRGDRDLSQEPLRADRGRDVGPQHLDRDLAAVPEVLGDVHGGHAAPAQLTLDRVAVAEVGRECFPHALQRGTLHR